MTEITRRQPRFADPDRTTRARIRDAAIAKFAADGVAATSLKSIADDAGVSTPLVIHHFGSKEGLRAACDEYVATEVRASKKEALAAGHSLDPFSAIRDAYEGTPLLMYLARTLADGSPHVDRLIDELVDDAVEYTAIGVDNGILKPTDHPREQAVVLTLWQLGALVLHEHAKRLLGADLSTGEGAAVWGLACAEILARGVMDEGFYEKVRDTVEQRTEA